MATHECQIHLFQMTKEEKAVVEELKTGVQKCMICKVGKVGPVARSKEKADLVIYLTCLPFVTCYVPGSRFQVAGCQVR